MTSPIGERAIEDVSQVGNAILKFISPNDVGLTGGHQRGYYLPKAAWQMYTPNPPTKGQNAEHAVSILWQDGRVTDSRCKWYGKGTRSEYRPTRFGPDFPWLTSDNVGDLLVLIPRSHTDYLGYVLDLDEDIDEIQAALGLQITRSWAAYQNFSAQIETEDECVEREFRIFSQALSSFPSGAVFSERTRQILEDCIAGIAALAADDLLLRSFDTEFKLFRLVERQVSQPEMVRIFRDVDDFLNTASSILNRRKVRAGRSLENHVDYLLSRAAIPHEMRPDIDGKPDVIIPGVEAYRDANYPVNRLWVIGIKTTCKDRWRQVLNEAQRIPHKYLLTVQQGISARQLTEMQQANLSLIVPERLHSMYPRAHQREILNVEDFIRTVQNGLQIE